MRSSATAALVMFCSVLAVAVAQQQPVSDQNLITADNVILYLKHATTWYQHVNAIEEGSSSSENFLLRSSAGEFARRARDSSFVFAHAQAAVLSDSPGTEGSSASSTLQQSLTKATNRVTRLQQRLQNLDAAIAHSAGAEHQALDDERVAIAADLALAKQVEAAVQQMSSFTAPKKGKGKGPLLDEINSLESLNPDTTPAATAGEKEKAQPDNDFLAFRPESAGVVVLLSKALGYYNTLHHIDAVQKETSALADEVDALRAPLRKSVRAIVAESDNISSQEDKAVQPAEWLAAGKEISELGVRFKQLSTVVIPLGETAMSLQSVRGTLDQWHKQIEGDFSSTLRYLAVRLAVLLAGVLLILLGSAIWQRAIYRYVTDPRRQRQLLLVKRVFVGLALALLATFGFFSSLSSIATLLGFITAGLALALQNVILSAVAYFFLIGRYGLRVGDRITVQGVTGEVVEVGFIRLFLMELTGSGTDIHPTGRLAVFANSVIFQPNALMKQAPGLEYTWHSVTVTIENPSDYQQTRSRLTQAVKSVYEGYRQAIDQQLKTFEQTTHVPGPAPNPTSRADFTERGLEVTVRYPVSLNEQPGHIDERMVDCIVAEANNEPQLKFAPGGTPKTSQVV